MSLLSDSSRRLLDHLEGRDAVDPEALDNVSMSPTATRIEDPAGDAEAVMNLLDTGSVVGVRGPNAWLQRQVKKDRPVDPLRAGMDAAGRDCCLRLLLSINSRLHNLPMPHRERCECGALWEIAPRVREHRLHR